MQHKKEGAKEAFTALLSDMVNFTIFISHLSSFHKRNYINEKYKKSYIYAYIFALHNYYTKLIFFLYFCQVRTSDLSYHDAKKSLKKDPRYEDCESLEREEKQALFETHIEVLTKRNRKIFHTLV